VVARLDQLRHQLSRGKAGEVEQCLVRLPASDWENDPMRWLLGVGLAAAVGGAASCDRPEVRAEDPPAGVVDSILPREEALRRFRQDLPPTSALAGGSANRDELVADFVRALRTRDTAGLAGMFITRSEFAYLYYPTTPESRPPYDLEPSLMWYLNFQRSERGIRRALQVYGGRRLQLLSYDCSQGGSREGDNIIWGPCLLRCRSGRGDTLSLWLFSQIIERDGRYKFLSYTNKL
jgi:hypothetical protein